MSVLTLRHTPPIRGIICEHIAFDHRDRIVEVGQHPGRQQPAHTCAKHHRVLGDLHHRGPRSASASEEEPPAPDLPATVMRLAIASTMPSKIHCQTGRSINQTVEIGLRCTNHFRGWTSMRGQW
jgi:hypothetical protein